MALILSGGAKEKAWASYTNDANYGYWLSEELNNGYERTSNETAKTFSFGTVTPSYNSGSSSIVCPAGCTVYAKGGVVTSDGSTPINVRQTTGDGGAVVIFAP